MRKKTDKMLVIEMRTGVPLEELIPLAYAESGQRLDLVAQSLCISRFTLYNWIGALGIELNGKAS